MKIVPRVLCFLLLSKFGFLSAFEYASQVGQDKWAVEEAFQFKTEGYFVDIGASEGVHISNTYVLEKHFQWKGICIEANPIFFKDLVVNRESVNVNACLDYTNHEVDFRYDHNYYSGIVDDDTDNKPSVTDSQIIKLQTKTLEQVLDECGAPQVIDFLTIDIEGAEERVFRDFPFEKYTFLALVIERPTPELNRKLQENGYVFVKNGPYDTFYVHPTIPNFEEIRKEPFSQIPKPW